MALLFISYAHEDVKIANRLQRDLEVAGHQIWRDDGRLEVGRRIPMGIASGVSSCDFLLILVTKNAVGSDWIVHELSAFVMEEGNLERVLPCVFDDTDPCKLTELLKPLKYASFNENYNEALGSLCRRLPVSTSTRKPKREDLERLDLAIDLALKSGSNIMRYYNSCLTENLALDDKKNARTRADNSAQMEIIKGIQSHPNFAQEPIIAEEPPFNSVTTEEASGSTYIWVIDPLDGTTNFQNHIPFFCTAIGVLRHEEPFIGVIYNPVANDLYFGIRGDQAKVWNISKGTVARLVSDSDCNSLHQCLAGTHISSRPNVAKELLQDDLLLDVERAVKHIRAFGCGQLALAYLAAGRLQLFFQFGSYLWDQVAGLAILSASKGECCQLPTGSKWDCRTSDFIAASNPRLIKSFLELLSSRKG